MLTSQHLCQYQQRVVTKAGMHVAGICTSCAIVVYFTRFHSVCCVTYISLFQTRERDFDFFIIYHFVSFL